MSISKQHTMTQSAASGIVERFLRTQSGIAMVEFALILPIMMTMFYGVVETTRYVLVTQKVEKLAHAVADLAGQGATTSTAVLNQVLSASSDIMNPFAMNSNGRVIISAIYRAPATANATVIWRHQGGGTLAATTRLGAVGATATVPAGFTFDERENVIAAEVYYRFEPLISSRFFGATTFYRSAYYKPRLGALLTPPV